MGISQTFYFIGNTDSGPDKLKYQMEASSIKKPRSPEYEEMLDEYRLYESPEFIEAFDYSMWSKLDIVTEIVSLMSPENGREFIQRCYEDYKKKFEPEWIDRIRAAQEKRCVRKKLPVIAYCKSIKWLPFYMESMCDGCNATDNDLKRLSMTFDAPILAFSIYDSDILFISFVEAKSDIICNHAKPNYDSFTDYDVDLYKKGFPVFLQDFCDKEKHHLLVDTWNSTGYAFAEDRMSDIQKILGITAIYNDQEAPEGFVLLSANCIGSS